MTTTLITGANRGLGYETARRLIEAGHTVYVGARDPQRGRQAASELGARYLPLDVTSDESVDAAAEQLDELDVLINNAGISGPRKPLPELTAADFHQVFDLNVYGPVRMIRRFLPLLERSANPVVVNVSSGLGSIAAAVDPDAVDTVPVWVPAPAYGASKAALNMLTVQYARQLPNLRINTVDPGYTATDFNGHNGYQTVEEGADIIVRLATIGPDGPTAEFLNLHGTVPW
ncbi:SDR family NAD(P)-dependent oxidoreductase [Kribbella sp.]|uniref:SDR family NAD(P)-dependent oxidoreductase n=1 Tax=Kribbella sp. TaxID=1871183 RepID=UPI002D712B69|nr:SDR family NAD(P)-dependent oxidoreductase [Kribbella sp.]HZX08799.1 SDR family NAD(P)-dependent oxidoreductase [Kribbella sp.]